MPTTYAETWFPVLVQIIIALGVAGAMIGLSALIGRRVRDTVKSTPYESGMKPVGNARERFSVKFYLVAMVFILFDIEAIFLYPWAVVFRDLNKSARFFPFFEMLENPGSFHPTTDAVFGIGPVHVRPCPAP